MGRRVLLLTAVAAAVAATYQSAATFQFLNWDDAAAIVGNSRLDLPSAASWALTTTHMEHYQPLSWLTWAAVKSGFGLSATAFHTANIVAHLIAVLLVWALARRVLARAVAGASAAALDGGATAAALLYGVHPLRVEVVAWISALPYAVALAFALASALVWLGGSSSADRSRRVWLALLLYAASLLARPIALGVPVVLVVLDVWLNRRTARDSAASALPFAALAAAAAAGEFVARAPGINETPWLYRLQAAASAPFIYIWRTAVPVALTPLDVLPLRLTADTAAAGLALFALLAVSAAAWRGRRRYPGFVAAWACYLALLAPAVGLVPSGLQASADRYSYLPGVVIAIAVAATGLRWTIRRPQHARLVAAACVAAVLACAIGSRSALSPWADSVSLWTRVISLEPTNDVGLYNLALALTVQGRTEEAASRYREVLAIAPGQLEARSNLDRLDAARLEREGNELAGRGDLAAASERYRQALARDAQRTHSHAALGMALASLGQASEALPHLTEAARQGEADPAVANLLGILLLQSGQIAEARTVFETALARHPSDLNLAHNLARLLVTGARTKPADAERALRLARSVFEATGEKDARALETIASALAASGRIAEADDANARAVRLAAAAGDRDLAVQIAARRRAYRSPGQ
jgi:protein O-mannosyl-transferase